MQWKHKLNHENRLGTKLTGSAFYKLFFNDCLKLLNSNSLHHSCCQHLYSTPKIILSCSFFFCLWKS